jgi:hypothetical protein
MLGVRRIDTFMFLGWRGRNERTHLEGIFPRSYVTVSDEKPALSIVSPQPISYGNLPLEVSQTGSPPGGRKPSKLEEQGKKFGKKMGNAGMWLPFPMSPLRPASLTVSQQSLAPERPSAPTSSTGSFNSHSPTLSTFLLRYLYISDENVLDSIGTGIQHEYNGVGGVDDVRPFCGFRESFGQTLVFSFSAYSHTILP